MVRSDKNQPLHQQLLEALLDKIDHMKQGGKLPSERELCELYGVSRTTVRNVITELEYRGFLKRIQGRGTFVAQHASLQNLSNYYSFTEETRRRGMTPRSLIVEYHIVPADENVRDVMGLAKSESVIEFLRLRLANEEPMLLENTCIPYQDFCDITRKMLEEHSLYEIFEANYQQKITTVNERFSVSVLDHKQAKLLKEKPQQPCLHIERRSYNSTGKMIEFTRSKASAFKFNYETTYHPA